jgi:hypothetical protein
MKAVAYHGNTGESVNKYRATCAAEILISLWRLRGAEKLRKYRMLMA